jgi:nitrogen regulatory protein PII
MELVKGIIYTRDMQKLTAALEAMGLIVHEIVYDGRRTMRNGVLEGIASVYNLINRVKIRVIISDELVGTIMDNLRSLGNCQFIILPKDQICLA